MVGAVEESGKWWHASSLGYNVEVSMSRGLLIYQVSFVESYIYAILESDCMS